MNQMTLESKNSKGPKSFLLNNSLRNESGHLKVRIISQIQNGPIALLGIDSKGKTVFEKWIKNEESEFVLTVPEIEKKRIASFRLEPRNPAREFGVNQILNVNLELITGQKGKSLKEITRAPFTTRADRSKPPKIASINTTEVCNLSCVMCHFNGPNAIKKSGTLSPDQVLKTLDMIPKGDEVWFCATGEFFIDRNALDYLKAAKARGLFPKVLTNGQAFSEKLLDEVLEAGVRMIRMSVDSTDPKTYRQIRKGGELGTILKVCEYLRKKKLSSYPDLRVEINATLFSSTFKKQAEMEDFWRPYVDQVNFNAEYHHSFEFRNLFYAPEVREDCDIQMYLMPSGYIAPCCAIAVYQHENDVSWLPHIDNIAGLQDAHKQLCDLYENKEGPMGKICARCEWWILSMKQPSAYSRVVPLHDNNGNNFLKKFTDLFKSFRKK